MQPQNLLIIMSDQHSRNTMGCYGHPLVRTPNLDRLAARGTRFTACWTPSPVCIPARAQVWLREEAPKYRDKPWVLFVSFVAPHYPLTAPPEHFYPYYNDPNLPMPRFYAAGERPDHPFVRDYARAFNFDDYFATPA